MKITFSSAEFPTVVLVKCIALVKLLIVLIVSSAQRWFSALGELKYITEISWCVHFLIGIVA